MKNTSKPRHSSGPTSIRPGSSTEDANQIGGPGDFGVPEANVAGRKYASANTKRSDPGAAQARAGEDGMRVSGVGGSASGPGSSSGGDLDPDVIGVGTGAGVATSGKIHEPAGPDDAQSTSSRRASDAPADDGSVE